MILDLLAAWDLCKRCADYRPQKITFGRAFAWIQQFHGKERAALRKATPHIKYFSEQEMVSDLVQANKELLVKLDAKGVKISEIIYVGIHDAGSSSHVVLNLLRDHGRLEKAGCSFVTVGPHNMIDFRTLTTKIRKGAIVYVDDFAGTGNQFCKIRKQVSEVINGNFSEFVLLHAVCEEGLSQIIKNDVEVVSTLVHYKTDRPLHENSSILNESERKLLRTRCLRISKGYGLGYERLASMVVYYRNSPNTTPLIFRGDLGQYPYVGLVPRTTDFSPASV